MFEKLTIRDFSGDADDVYSSDLFTIFINIHDDIYPLLEQAVAQNKRLAIVEPIDINFKEYDEFGFKDIIIV